MLEWHDLNARHEAALFWIGLFLLFAIAKSAGVRQSTRGLLRSFLAPLVSGLIIILVIVSALSATLAVLLGRAIGLFEVLPIVTVTIWCITSGFSMLFHLGESRRRNNSLGSSAFKILWPSTIIAALANVTIWSLWIEIVMVPFITLFALIPIANSSRANARPAVIFSEALLSVYGFLLLAVAIVEVVQEPDTWRTLGQTIVLPAWLTLTALPYIKGILVAERIRFRLGAKCKAIGREEYGPDWPLSVDSAKLCCKHNAVWVEIGNRKYGINGTSHAVLKRFGFTIHELGDLWRDDPRWQDIRDAVGVDESVEPWKVSLHRLIHDGLDLCNNG